VIEHERIDFPWTVALLEVLCADPAIESCGEPTQFVRFVAKDFQTTRYFA
jgi:hypothetical protein